MLPFILTWPAPARSSQNLEVPWLCFLLLLLNPAWDWQCHTCFWGLAQAPVMFVKALLHCGQENAWKNSFPWSKALLWVLVLWDVFCNSITQQLVPTETKKGLATHRRGGGWWAAWSSTRCPCGWASPGHCHFQKPAPKLPDCGSWKPVGHPFTVPGWFVMATSAFLEQTTKATLTYSATKWDFSEECRDERPTKAIWHPAFKPLTMCGSHNAVEGQSSLKRRTGRNTHICTQKSVSSFMSLLILQCHPEQRNQKYSCWHRILLDQCLVWYWHKARRTMKQDNRTTLQPLQMVCTNLHFRNRFWQCFIVELNFAKHLSFPLTTKS